MTLKEICEHLIHEDNYILTSHEAPDGDAIGSEIVLYSILKYLKKKVIILNSDATEQKYGYMDIDNVIQFITPGDKLPRNLSEKTLIVMDTEPDNIGHLSGVLNEAMFSGIVYDTGSFIYPKTTAKTFDIAHKLVKNGARPNFVYSHLYESKSTESLKLRTMVGSTMSLHFNDHVAYQYMDRKTLLESGAKYEESQEIVNIPLQCNEVRVSIFIKENAEGQARCSIRTKNEIDCLPIVSHFHGGGHPTAAGFKLKTSVEEVRREVLEFFASLFT
ncbi:DHHA1 domain-containing protein [Oceanispirochaeta sp.]|jgi:phosphoesterase RecJ-like protein|uniref:DHH family phosphoesterase n=1 Tax=Oceanispirochaeta sp. TaxID=2035350 RepID=UPI00262B9606|nr:DHHA1 domain-containing protein [Oceanispirochaeta sp.]MDA3956895.1 DHHA1 domain-containing protein [Oceanispirochaeta sp.]